MCIAETCSKIVKQAIPLVVTEEEITGKDVLKVPVPTWPAGELSIAFLLSL